MKEVPKKDLPDVAGGQTPGITVPSDIPEISYPQYPTIPGPTDQIDPFADRY